jgi:tRNA(fMet)-specific endonuclease VapC
LSFIFDTNSISALVHQRAGFARLAAKIEPLALRQRIVSAITLAELRTMVAKARAPADKDARLRLVLSEFAFADFDTAAAVHAGEIRAALEARGMGIGPLDTLIAAHARSLGATVVTSNISEFARVPGLRAVDWLR